MTFTRHLCILSLAAAALALATPALALNPQPLPPGMRFNPAAVNHAQGMGAWNKGPLVLRCHGVQIGDPRTHPPVRVCTARAQLPATSCLGAFWTPVS